MKAIAIRLFSYLTTGGLLKRTLISVTGFGLGSLLLAGLLSLIFVGAAESLLPATPSDTDSTGPDEPAATATPRMKRPPATEGRGVRAERRAGSPRRAANAPTPNSADERPL